MLVYLSKLVRFYTRQRLILRRQRVLVVDTHHIYEYERASGEVFGLYIVKYRVKS